MSKEEVSRMILEYAAKFQHVDVVNVMYVNQALTPIHDVLLSTVTVYKIISLQDIDRFELAVTILQQIYDHEPGCCSFKQMSRLILGIKMKLMLVLLRRDSEDMLLKLNEHLPKNGFSFITEDKNALSEMNTRTKEFRKFLLPLIVDSVLRRDYFHHKYQQEFGDTYSESLTKLTKTVLSQITWFLPRNQLEVLMSKGQDIPQYLSDSPAGKVVLDYIKDKEKLDGDSLMCLLKLLKDHDQLSRSAEMNLLMRYEREESHITDVDQRSQRKEHNKTMMRTKMRYPRGRDHMNRSKPEEDQNTTSLAMKVRQQLMDYECMDSPLCEEVIVTGKSPKLYLCDKNFGNIGEMCTHFKDQTNLIDLLDRPKHNTRSSASRQKSSEDDISLSVCDNSLKNVQKRKTSIKNKPHNPVESTQCHKFDGEICSSSSNGRYRFVPSRFYKSTTGSLTGKIDNKSCQYRKKSQTKRCVVAQPVRRCRRYGDKLDRKSTSRMKLRNLNKGGKRKDKMCFSENEKHSRCDVKTRNVRIRKVYCTENNDKMCSTEDESCSTEDESCRNGGGDNDSMCLSKRIACDRKSTRTSQLDKNSKLCLSKDAPWLDLDEKTVRICSDLKVKLKLLHLKNIRNKNNSNQISEENFYAPQQKTCSANEMVGPDSKQETTLEGKSKGIQCKTQTVMKSRKEGVNADDKVLERPEENTESVLPDGNAEEDNMAVSDDEISDIIEVIPNIVTLNTSAGCKKKHKLKITLPKTEFIGNEFSASKQIFSDGLEHTLDVTIAELDSVLDVPGSDSVERSALITVQKWQEDHVEYFESEKGESSQNQCNTHNKENKKCHVIREKNSRSKRSFIKKKTTQVDSKVNSKEHGYSGRSMRLRSRRTLVDSQLQQNNTIQNGVHAETCKRSSIENTVDEYFEPIKGTESTDMCLFRLDREAEMHGKKIGEASVAASDIGSIVEPSVRSVQLEDLDLDILTEEDPMFTDQQTVNTVPNLKVFLS